jgi:hypothetical protein
LDIDGEQYADEKSKSNHGTMRILPDHSNRRNLRDRRNRKSARGIGVMGCAKRTQLPCGSRCENATNEPNGLKIERRERDEQSPTRREQRFLRNEPNFVLK